MIKLLLKFSLVCCLAFSSLSQATLITPQDESELKLNEDYIQYTYDGTIYDIVWASNVSSERWYVDRSYNFNTLFAPTYYLNSGWGYAGESGIPELTTIFTGLTGSEIETLFVVNNQYVDAFSHFNSIFNGVTNNNDILNLNIKSSWSWSVPASDIDLSDMDQKRAQRTDITSTSGVTYDTFYVRVSSAAVNDPLPIPEPTTLMVFSLALIALVGRKKLSK